MLVSVRNTIAFSGKPTRNLRDELLNRLIQEQSKDSKSQKVVPNRHAPGKSNQTKALKKATRDRPELPNFMRFVTQMYSFDPVEAHTGKPIYPGLLTPDDSLHCAEWAFKQRDFHPVDAARMASNATQLLVNLETQGYWVLPRTNLTPLIVDRTVVKQLQKPIAEIMGVVQQLRSVGSHAPRNPRARIVEFWSRAKHIAGRDSLLRVIPEETTQRLFALTVDKKQSLKGVAQTLLGELLLSAYQQKLVDGSIHPDTITQAIEHAPKYPLREFKPETRTFEPPSDSFLKYTDWKPEKKRKRDGGDGFRFSQSG